MPYEYKVTKELKDGDIEDILTTALEGGIGYWACLLNDDPAWEKAHKEIKDAGETPYWSTVMWRVLQSGEKVRFQDADDTEDGEIWEYDLKSFKQSCERYEEERGSLKKCLDDGNFDAVEADIFIQLGLFGEVVFG